MSSYSFIQPKAKSIFRRFTKFWLFYILLMIVCIGVFDRFLETRIDGKQYEVVDMDDQTKEVSEKITATKEYIARLVYEQNTVALIDEKIGGVKSTNQRFRSGFERLVNLIPAQITLKSIRIDERKLELKGITPSEEVYKFLLEAPLKASFDESRVDFFPLVNGWFHFTSVSKRSEPLRKGKEEEDE